MRHLARIFFKTSWSVPQKFQKALARIQTNNFNTERTLTDYRQDFKGKLYGLLKNLNQSHQSWIDMGAGSARAKIHSLENLYPDVFKNTEGMQTPANIREMKPTNLITDDTALVQYADSIGLEGNEFVKAYIDITKSGGHILVSSYSKEKLFRLPQSYLKQLEIVEIIQDEGVAPFLFIKKR